jgi:hypothetical protein
MILIRYIGNRQFIFLAIRKNIIIWFFIVTKGSSVDGKGCWNVDFHLFHYITFFPSLPKFISAKESRARQKIKSQ